MTTLSIRPLKEEDIPNIVNYWFENKDENLIQMGVDKIKLISQTRFINSLPYLELVRFE